MQLRWRLRGWKRNSKENLQTRCYTWDLDDSRLAWDNGEGGAPTHQALTGVKDGSFQQLFWSQQKEAAACKDKCGMRWHLTIIKWCLFLRHQCSKAYETLHRSGCINLPSQRTLQDYSQCVKSAAGFSLDVDQQLMQATSIATCQPWETYAAILIDEMYICRNLVFEKCTEKLIGFVSLGDVNDHLLAFEKLLEEDCCDDKVYS